MSTEYLPLHRLFSRLRMAGMPLGIADYLLVLRSFQLGYGLENLAALSRLCRCLWVKSAADQEILDYHFGELFNQSSASRADEDLSLPEANMQIQSSGIAAVEEPVLPAPVPEGGQFEQTDTMNAEPGAEVSTETSGAALPPSAESLESGLNLVGIDEIQLAQAIHAVAVDQDTVYPTWYKPTDYHPVKLREMKQSWRHLRRTIRAGPQQELDVEATVRRIERDGLFLDPALTPARTNKSSLLMLLDQRGSMSPFHDLTRRLADSAIRGGRLQRTQVYHFYNCPYEHLFRTASLSQPVPVEAVLARYPSYMTLIVSDGGAARGRWNRDRIEATRDFITQLRRLSYRAVWLNPVPHMRWSGTSAGDIAAIIPMFDISRRGLDDAIDVLKGKPHLRWQPDLE